ncbi:MAG: protein kinase domain-containing protein [Fibrobacterota bacterium]
MSEISNNRETFGRYQVLKLLGKGAMGRVYLSEDPILKRQVAVKVIAMDNHLNSATLKEYLERFALEAQACARLNHPSVVSIYDAGEENGIPWIAFEYVDGEQLDHLIRAEKQLSFEKAAAIISDIASAISHAHSMNIVHRDIKPANILIDNRTGTAKLTDFGVVKSPCSAVTQSGSSVGSPGYMSPEQIDGTEVDSRSDIFSLGIVLYEMITGTHPFLRETIPTTFYATLNCKYTPVRELRNDVPEVFEQIINRSLVCRSSDRIQEARQICTMLENKKETWTTRSAYLLFARHLWKIITTTVKYILIFTRKAIVFLVPLIKKTCDILYRFCRDHLFPFLRSTVRRIYAFLRQRFSKKQINTTIIALPTSAAIIITILLLITASGKKRDYERLRVRAESSGFTASHGSHLADSCRAMISRNELDRAEELAAILDSHKVSSVQGKIFKGILAIGEKKFMEATSIFSKLNKNRSAAKAIREEHPFLLSILEKKLEDELPSPMVSLCAHQLGLADNPKLKIWTEDKHYWVRWNAVRILQNAGREVDMVPVYILDLTYSGSYRTKVKAVENLGLIGDSRAIPALIEHSESGPASRTAAQVLKDDFGYEKD